MWLLMLITLESGQDDSEIFKKVVDIERVQVLDKKTCMDLGGGMMASYRNVEFKCLPLSKSNQ